MFESTWGHYFEVWVGECGTREVRPELAERYSLMWRADLNQKRREWEPTAAAKRCRDKMQQAFYERMEREAQLEDEEDVAREEEQRQPFGWRRGQLNRRRPQSS